MERINATHYTNDYIVERAAQYGSLKELRDDSFGFYQLVRRRGLLETVRALYTPIKLRKIKEVKPRERKRPGPKPKVIKEVKVKPLKILQVYKHTFQDEVKICGRCFIEEPKTPRSILCQKCQKIYFYKYAYEKPHTPWNIKQEYCNTIITHYEKRFEIGIRVEEKLQKYLTLVGYQFIFQDPWENLWK